MRLSMSEMAWSPVEEKRVLRQLAPLDGVSVSYGRLLASIRSPRQSVITRARAKKKLLAEFDKSVVMLEQVADITHGNLTSEAGRARLVERIEDAILVADALEAPAITVLGPSLRRTPGFKPHEWRKDWEYLVERSAEYGVRLILEPVARVHGVHFWDTTESVEGFIQACGYGASIGLNTSSLAFEEKPRSALTSYASQVPVFVASEPGQGPVMARGPVPHRKFAAELSRLRSVDRAPQWLNLRYRRPQYRALEMAPAALDRVRVLYANVLR